jgi:hypothetical protein
LELEQEMAKGLFDGKMMLVLENIDFSLKKHLQKTILGKKIFGAL